MLTKENAISIVKEYIMMCESRNIRILKAILFGSFSKGHQTEMSDIDLLLVSDNFNEMSLLNHRMLAPITAKLFDVEVHPYPTAHFIQGDPFIEEIIKTGIEIKI